MITKIVILFSFVTIISLFFPFLMGQIQSQIIAPQLLVSNVSPPPLIAKEEEVNQFFDHYAALYKRKDVDGFLSFHRKPLGRITGISDGINSTCCLPNP